MKVSELSAVDGFETAVMPDADRVIKGAYIGDLLSWVMGRARADNAWITIMTNINIVAVAALTDVSCIILAEGVKPDTQVLDTAKAKGINIVCTDMPAYETALLLGSFGK